MVMLKQTLQTGNFHKMNMINTEVPQYTMNRKLLNSCCSGQKCSAIKKKYNKTKMSIVQWQTQVEIYLYIHPVCTAGLNRHGSEFDATSKFMMFG
jgi:hypothetical protein